MADSIYFSTSDRDTLHNIMAARRDMRHFLPHKKIDDETLVSWKPRIPRLRSA